MGGAKPLLPAGLKMCAEGEDCRPVFAAKEKPSSTQVVALSSVPCCTESWLRLPGPCFPILFTLHSVVFRTGRCYPEGRDTIAYWHLWRSEPFSLSLILNVYFLFVVSCLAAQCFWSSLKRWRRIDMLGSLMPHKSFLAEALASLWGL